MSLFSVSVSPKGVLQRPAAGSQVPCCPIEKKMSDCWSPLDPSTFKVRGHNYIRYKIDIRIVFFDRSLVTGQRVHNKMCKL